MDIFNTGPNSVIKVVQKVLVNLEFRSETIVSGKPWCRKMLLRNILAVSSAVMLVVIGSKCTCLLYRSMTVKMASCPAAVLGS